METRKLERVCYYVAIAVLIIALAMLSQQNTRSTAHMNERLKLEQRKVVALEEEKIQLIQLNEQMGESVQRLKGYREFLPAPGTWGDIHP